MDKVLKTLIINILKEAEISQNCLLDDIPTDTNIYKDIVHIQKQITLAINKLQEHA